MCGICGTAGFEDKHLLREMCSVMKHRGPDDAGTFLDTAACNLKFTGSTGHRTSKSLYNPNEEYGVDLPHQLPGMFVFSVWNLNKNGYLLINLNPFLCEK